jgi:hypothetical protein
MRRWTTIGLVAGCAVTAALGLWPRHRATLVDLVDAFPTAKRQPASGLLLEPVTIGNETRRSIVTHGHTRLTYHVTLPKHAELRVSLAVHPSIWADAADGVMFVGISDGRTYRTVKAVTLAPRDRPADRHWRELTCSLEEYAGLTVDVVFNTRAASNPERFLAVWGAPNVAVR